MKLRPLAIVLTLPLWACASQPASGPAAGSAAPPASSAAAAPAPESGTHRALSIIATPIYLAFKLPFCLGAPLVAAPGAAVSSVIPFTDASNGSGWQSLSNNVSAACGPPYMADAH